MRHAGWEHPAGRTFFGKEMRITPGKFVERLRVEASRPVNIGNAFEARG